jgi:enoyl-CoA hydratase/carnithine racemase
MSNQAFHEVTVSIDGTIGRLTLNRPDKLNPLSVTMLDEIARATRWFDGRRAKVVVIAGAGRAFTAGADLSTFASTPDASTPDASTPDNSTADDGSGVDTWAAADRGRRMAEALESMEALAIASIQGWCVGGGVVLAAACDLRIAADDARFSIPEVDLGIPLAWGGIPRLVRELGPAVAKELVLTCRPFAAAEALSLGFLNQVVPAAELQAATDELAAIIDAKARFTITATKQHVNAVTSQMVGTERSWSDAGTLVQAFTDAECRAARRHYLEQRSP